MAFEHPVRVVAVVIDGTHVLLKRHRDTGRHELPSAVLRPGEQVLAALRRSVEESAALIVTSDRLCGVCTWTWKPGLDLVFRSRHVAGQLRSVDPLVVCRWVPVDAVMLDREAREYLRLATVTDTGRPHLLHHGGRSTLIPFVQAAGRVVSR